MKRILILSVILGMFSCQETEKLGKAEILKWAESENSNMGRLSAEVLGAQARNDEALRAIITESGLLQYSYGQGNRSWKEVSLFYDQIVLVKYAQHELNDYLKYRTLHVLFNETNLLRDKSHEAYEKIRFFTKEAIYCNWANTQDQIMGLNSLKSEDEELKRKLAALASLNIKKAINGIEGDIEKAQKENNKYVLDLEIGNILQEYKSAETKFLEMI